MEWTKATIQTTTFGAEVVTGLLMAAGITSAEIIDPCDRVRHLEGISPTWDYVDESLMKAETDDALVVFYVTKDDDGDLLVEDVKTRLNIAEMDGMGKLTLSLESADEENWANEWKKHFKPLRIGKVVVVPEWENYPPASDDVVLRIDPGAAFGTGQHQTTQLCIMAMQEFVRPGDLMLDVGCGSGILSVLGLLLGAEFVLACDIDPAGAMAATKRNATLNRIDMNRMAIKSGDILNELGHELLQGEKHDVVVANIVADVVSELALIVPDFLKPEGIFIASGIISERLDDVLSAFSGGGLSVVWQTELEDWHCVVGKVL